MKVRAPGKVLLTGAYAVLEGAPALVVAVDRYAHADTSRPAEDPTAEVAHALGDQAPYCDRSDLYQDGTKVGLGSSAAVLVASLGATLAARGADLESSEVRGSIFSRARDAHMQVQGGGSGFDVAASTYGGVLRYSLLSGVPCVLSAELPDGLHMAVYFSGTSARTSDLVAQVNAFREHDREAHARCLIALASASEFAVRQCQAGTAREFIASVRTFGEALEELGEAADSPIVPLAFKRLTVAAAEERATFLPSGAGGGDIGVFLGEAPPSENFIQRALQLGMRPLTLAIDRKGVCATPA
ncbi:mevalonate kinase [Pendulispora albinea]|uniref:phosphomevalonate kinase n=1 Tax=Pendulispora albinea TaxID=2741071 RepID=A0ABZ2MBM2_9BACT